MQPYLPSVGTSQDGQLGGRVAVRLWTLDVDGPSWGQRSPGRVMKGVHGVLALEADVGTGMRESS